MKIFLCGHGNYYPSDGYFQLPPKTTVTFWGAHMRALDHSEVIAVLEGRTENPNRVFGQYSVCPNMTLTPEVASAELRTEETYIRESEEALKRNPDRDNCRMVNCNRAGADKLMLRALVLKAPGHDYHWTCCSVSLKKAAGNVAAAVRLAGALNVADIPGYLQHTEPGVVDAKAQRLMAERTVMAFNPDSKRLSTTRLNQLMDTRFLRDFAERDREARAKRREALEKARSRFRP